MKYLATLFTLAVLCFSTNATASSLNFTRDLEIDSNWFEDDSTYLDSLVYEFYSDSWFNYKRRRSFLITDIESPRQYHYTENFSMLEFNRVDGFFLGLGSSNMVNMGPHDEFGMNGGVGYAFEDQRWAYFLGAELRLPLEPLPSKDDTFRHDGLFYLPMTLAAGGEFHNRTQTPDHWRMRQAENTQYAFWAREDARDYYKLAGWSTHLAFRPMRNRELRLEYRWDSYEQRDQTVFYGRFGGNKRLPPNPHETDLTPHQLDSNGNPTGAPTINHGDMGSIVLTYHGEGVEKRSHEDVNLMGDSVEYDQLYGFSTLLQGEFGKMKSSDFSFNKYLLDFRSFVPIMSGLAFDSRFRFESSIGETPFQKLSALGGPGSLHALGYKELIGNRLLLLNTEIRTHLAMFSEIFGSGMQLAILNDFGFVTNETEDVSIFEGFGKMVINTIVYNIGIALGHVSGIQLGSYWRTDRRDDAQLFFRLERPF